MSSHLVVVNAKVVVAPEDMEQFSSYVENMVDQTRKEPACVNYSFAVDATDGFNTVRVSEEWQSEEGFEEHLQSSHMREFMSGIRNCKIMDMQVRKYQVLAATDLQIE
tara:strand:+ start:481 stop:804 length:324 start_codon:yes stop_codon:yes gene_type:complete